MTTSMPLSNGQGERVALVNFGGWHQDVSVLDGRDHLRADCAFRAEHSNERAPTPLPAAQCIPASQR
jgi:hypothetical protein